MRGRSWSIQGADYQRRVIDTGEVLRDWTVGLTTTLRMPGKAGIDQELAKNVAEAGELRVGDALHETAKDLLSVWFTWVSAAEQRDIWQQQTGLMQQQLEAVKHRVTAGDAAAIERNLAQAAQLQAQIALQQALLRETNAASQLRIRYPDLTLPATPPLSPPIALQRPLASWLESGLGDNHELLLAKNGSHQAQLNAKRTDAEKVPDPTVSLIYMSERSGLDKFAGLSVSVPIPGAIRRYASDEQQAQADAALQKEALVQQRLRDTITSAYATAQSAWQNWQYAQQASTLTQSNAQQITRAYTLGEASLNDTLLAQRQQLDARLGEIQAALDANESRYRLMLDTHQLWLKEADAY